MVKLKNSLPDVTFPEIRALKAKYGLTDDDIGEIIGNTSVTISKKMRLVYDFSLSEMITLSNYFISKGEKEGDANVQTLFCDWIISNEIL
jgi:hypothetical protein